MKKLQDAAAYIFIIAVAVLSTVSILGVWEVFDRDVITKSFQTLGLLAVVAIVVMVAAHFIEGKAQSADPSIGLPSPQFKNIRRGTLSTLVVAVSLLALAGVLTIWEIIHDKQVLYKSVGSLAILAFGAFVMTLTCLERENKIVWSQKYSALSILAALIVAYMIFRLIFGLSGLFH